MNRPPDGITLGESAYAEESTRTRFDMARLLAAAEAAEAGVCASTKTTLAAHEAIAVLVHQISAELITLTSHHLPLMVRHAGALALGARANDGLAFAADVVGVALVGDLLGLRLDHVDVGITRCGRSGLAALFQSVLPIINHSLITGLFE